MLDFVDISSVKLTEVNIVATMWGFGYFFRKPKNPRILVSTLLTYSPADRSQMANKKQPSWPALHGSMSQTVYRSSHFFQGTQSPSQDSDESLAGVDCKSLCQMWVLRFTLRLCTDWVESAWEREVSAPAVSDADLFPEASLYFTAFLFVCSGTLYTGYPLWLIGRSV